MKIDRFHRSKISIYLFANRKERIEQLYTPTLNCKPVTKKMTSPFSVKLLKYIEGSTLLQPFQKQQSIRKSQDIAQEKR